MKKLFILMFVLLVSVKLAAQSDKVFHTYIYNDEFKVYMDINLYENNVIVPDQELFGEIPGYFGAKRDQRKWLITSAKIDGKNSATLEIVNDYYQEFFRPFYERETRLLTELNEGIHEVVMHLLMNHSH